MTITDYYEKIARDDFGDESENAYAMLAPEDVTSRVVSAASEWLRESFKARLYAIAEIAESNEMLREARGQLYSLRSGVLKAGDGVARIAYERARQVEVEGFNTTHDTRHDHSHGELAAAAAAYANWSMAHGSPGDDLPPVWPWDTEWWKPSDDPIRNLEKAGALIAAEIDRLLVEAESIDPSETLIKTARHATR